MVAKFVTVALSKLSRLSQIDHRAQIDLGEVKLITVVKLIPVTYLKFKTIPGPNSCLMFIDSAAVVFQVKIMMSIQLC